MSTPTDITVFPSPYTCGLTLRDYFAAAAMQGLIVADDWDIGEAKDSETIEPHHIAAESYRLADAMLAEREKP